MESELLKNKSPEAKRLLQTIPGRVLRWGMLFLSILFAVVIFSSFQLVYFDYEIPTTAYVTKNKELNINNTEININEIRYISIENELLEKGSDFNISYIDDELMSIKIISPNLAMIAQNKGVDVIIHLKKSLFKIIIGDIRGK